MHARPVKSPGEVKGGLANDLREGKEKKSRGVRQKNQEEKKKAEIPLLKRSVWESRYPSWFGPFRRSRADDKQPFSSPLLSVSSSRVSTSEGVREKKPGLRDMSITSHRGGGARASERVCVCVREREREGGSERGERLLR